MKYTLNQSPLLINLVAAWVGILLGFLSGMLMGLFFHRENWLGGYASPKRRMYRLGHISFFGLGAVNLLFWLTFREQPTHAILRAASLQFLVGALTMPLCCVVMAHFPKANCLFAVPVLSLLAAGSLVVISLFQTIERKEFSAALKTGSFAGVPAKCFCINNSPVGPWLFNTY